MRKTVTDVMEVTSITTVNAVKMDNLWGVPSQEVAMISSVSETIEISAYRVRPTNRLLFFCNAENIKKC